jgi:auxin-responsive protein IAA
MAATTADDEDVKGAPRSSMVTVEPPRQSANMFAKVHMDGCLIARKINLRAHRSYDSLSRALTKMTRNFFCRKCTALLFFFWHPTALHLYIHFFS